ncbi:hypothetical protein [Bdellovibrio sp. NC01]|uniref:hypothetical protein n=1 Tax=Bdellovibrio sp. NC01 TaxID=2220073 RepID=UPI001158106B|nr:hypothetical protein [Bdellovibrio sp. NC01]QDK37928.1 hypothetical protein DOE51_10195 [Bdellovibrio sp. NC01]
MKLLILTIMGWLALFSFDSAFAAPQFLDFKLSATKYAVGQSAVLIAYTKILPTNSSVETYVEGSLDGNPIEVLQLANNLSISVTSPLTEVGSHSWKVSVYVQDKKLAQFYRESIFSYQKLVDEIDANINNEVEPTKIALLLQEKNEKLALIESVSAMEARNRIKVSSQYFFFDVSSTKINLSSTPLLTIEPANSLSEFSVGQHALFYVSVGGILGNEDGPFDYGVDCSAIEAISAISFATQKMDKTYFTCASEQLISANLGNWTISANLKVRSEKKVQAIKAVLLAANQKKADYLAQANISDELAEAYFQAKAAQLTVTIAHLSSLQSTLWENIIPPVSQSFEVVAPFTEGHNVW